MFVFRGTFITFWAMLFIPVLVGTVSCTGDTAARADFATEQLKILADSLSAGDAARVRELISWGADVDVMNNDRITPLHMAVRYGLTDIAQLLLEAKADANGGHEADGATPLLLAAMLNEVAIARLLLDNGADVNTRLIATSQNALLTASKCGHAEFVRLLLNRGADVNARDGKYGATALHIAANDGHTEIVRMLLENGADVNARDSERGATALFQASGRGHTEIVRMLLENGADVNVRVSSDSLNALYVPSAWGHTEIVRMLLQKGADLYGELNGKTMLEAATDAGHQAIAQLLEEARVNRPPLIETINISVHVHNNPCIVTSGQFGFKGGDGEAWGEIEHEYTEVRPEAGRVFVQLSVLLTPSLARKFDFDALYILTAGGDKLGSSPRDLGRQDAWNDRSHITLNLARGIERLIEAIWLIDRVELESATLVIDGAQYPLAELL
jgi:ankyrin repeat protein